MDSDTDRELDGDDRLIVTFSDGTVGAYVVEELLALRPKRERERVQNKRASAKLTVVKKLD